MSVPFRSDVVLAVKNERIGWRLYLLIETWVETPTNLCNIPHNRGAVEPRRFRKSRRPGVYLPRIIEILITIRVCGNESLIGQEQVVPVSLLQLGGIIVLRGKQLQVGYVVENHLPLKIIQGCRQLILQVDCAEPYVGLQG